MLFIVHYIGEQFTLGYPKVTEGGLWWAVFLKSFHTPYTAR